MALFWATSKFVRVDDSYCAIAGHVMGLLPSPLRTVYTVMSHVLRDVLSLRNAL